MSYPNNTFSLVLRKYLTENARRSLMMALLFIGVPLLFGIWMGIFTGLHYGPSSYGVYSLSVSAAWLLVIAGAFPELARPQGRIRLLMIPARTSDIYFSRLLTLFIFFAILFIAGWLAYCGANLITVGLCYGEWQAPSIFPGNPFNGDSDPASAWLLLISILLFVGSAYFYGAIAWPKRSFLITSGLLIALNFALSFFYLAIFKFVKPTAITLSDADTFLWFLVVIMYIIDAAILSAAYFKLKRATVI